MKRRTIKLSEEVDALLRHEAQLRRLTISEITREAVEEYLGVTKRRRFLVAGAGSSGQSDISERVEEILHEELGRPR